MAARLFCCEMVECTLGAVGGGTSDLGLNGADPMVTEYWSYTLSLTSGLFLSIFIKELDTAGAFSVANSLVMWISVVLVLVKGFSICTGTGRDGLLNARNCLRLANISRPART